MGEPIVVFVVGQLLLIAAVGLHAPELHFPAAYGIEVDEFSVG